MQQLYLTRRNLLTLLNKLDRAKKGEITTRSLVKQDTVHPLYPCSDSIMITALEDEEYYTDREAGQVHSKDAPKTSRAAQKTDDFNARSPKDG